MCKGFFPMGQKALLKSFATSHGIKTFAQYLIWRKNCNCKGNFFPIVYLVNHIEIHNASQILCEIIVSHFETPKNCHFDNLSSSKVSIFGNLNIFIFQEWSFSKKSKFKAFKMVITAVFDLLKSAKTDFTQNQSGRKIDNFLRCEISKVKSP